MIRLWVTRTAAWLRAPHSRKSRKSGCVPCAEWARICSSLPDKNPVAQVKKDAMRPVPHPQDGDGSHGKASLAEAHRFKTAVHNLHKTRYDGIFIITLPVAAYAKIKCVPIAWPVFRLSLPILNTFAIKSPLNNKTTSGSH